VSGGAGGASPVVARENWDRRHGEPLLRTPRRGCVPCAGGGDGPSSWGLATRRWTFAGTGANGEWTPARYLQLSSGDVDASGGTWRGIGR